MTNRLRFGEDEHTKQILRDFARRLDPQADAQRLSQVRTTLTYADGQTFTYTLNPKNFSVEEWDEAQMCYSPVNDTTRSRRVVFYIRDEDGTEHGPIGTTSILKDIFGLERAHVADTERLLLDAAYAAEQEAKWELAQAAEDPLVYYAYLNGLPTHFFTHNYQRQYAGQYGEHDPIAAAIRNIIEGRVRLDRKTVQRLRSEASRKGSGSALKLSGAAAQAGAPAAEAAKPRRTISVTADILNWIAPLRNALLGKLSAGEGGEFSHLMDWAARVNKPGLGSKIDYDLFKRLEELTQLSLNTQAYLARARRKGGALTEDEARQINMRLSGKEERKHPAPAPKPSPAPPATQGRAINLQHRRLWQERVPLLRYMNVPPELLLRAREGQLNADDPQELQRCWDNSEQGRRGQDPLGPPKYLKVPTSFVKLLSQDEQAALSVARQQKKWPPALRAALEQRAEAHGLNPQTFAPPRIEDGVRAALQRDLPELTAMSAVGAGEAERIRRTLTKNKPSVEDLRFIEKVQATPVSGCFTLAQRQLLLHGLSHNAETEGRKGKRRAALRGALNADRYTLAQAAELRRLLGSLEQSRPQEEVTALEQGTPRKAAESAQESSPEAPYEIPQDVRQILKGHMGLFARQGRDTEQLWNMLNKERATAEEVQLIDELRNQPVQGGLPADKRQELLNMLSEQKHPELRRALEEDRYTLEQVSRLMQLLRSQQGGERPPQKTVTPK